MGLILDSSVAIAGERRGDTVRVLLYRVIVTAGDQEAALSAVGVVDLIHGIHRADTPERRARRETFVEELIGWPRRATTAGRESSRADNDGDDAAEFFTVTRRIVRTAAGHDAARSANGALRPQATSVRLCGHGSGQTSRHHGTLS